MQWTALLQKELIESWRNRKWIWVPLVFMLIAILDPLTYYFLPDIIELSGDMPEGAVIDFPELEATDAVLASINSLSIYGVMIIALITMGTISGEKKSGVTEIILVKPVRYMNYLSAKLMANSLLVVCSVFLGLALSWYYINLLFGDISMSLFFLTACFYSLWFCFFISLSIFYNTLFNSPGAVAASTIGTYFLLGAVNTVLGHKLSWFPNQINVHFQEMIVTNKVPDDMWGTVFIICMLIVILFIGSIFFFRSRVVSR